MAFLWPAMLLLLLLLPPLGAGYVWAQRRQSVPPAQTSRGGLFGAAGPRPGMRRHVPPALFLLALTLLALAMARPVAAVSLPRLEGTVILVFDVSASMAADDLEPTRLGAAQAAAAAFVERQPPTVRIGVVAFSDGGLAVQPPTADRAEVLATIGRLRPERGTSIGEGMLVALNTIAQATGTEATAAEPGTQEPAPQPRHDAAVIVLLSDGENNARPDPLEVALEAATRGVQIFTVGVGSAAGVTLELDGFTVHSRLEAETLRQIAQLTEGAYFSAEEREELDRIYGEVGARLVVRPEETEVTALFVGAGLLLLLVGGLCSLFWFSRMP